VQYFLFRQLADAYRRIVDMGVQLVLDFEPKEGFSKLARQMEIWSRCAHAIHLIGMDLYVPPFRREVIESTFGRDSEFVLTNLCQQRGSEFVFPSRPPDLMISADVREKVEDLRRYAAEADEGKCRRFLRVNSGLWASAVVIDATTTQFFGSRTVWEEFGMIPAREAGFEGRLFAMMPIRVAPDVISEFPEEMRDERIRGVIEERVRSKEAISVTMYLYDLLAGFGGYRREKPRPIQIVPGHCRFSFPFSVQELKWETELNGRIRQFLSGCRRNV
jgi:hypothetical protein